MGTITAEPELNWRLTRIGETGMGGIKGEKMPTGLLEK
jgi:hypothetical protein